MVKFLELAEQGASANKWRQELGMKPGDVRIHLRFTTYYRLYIKMYKEIKELQAERSQLKSREEKDKVGNKIRLVRTKYRPILSKARSTPSNEFQL